MRRFVHEMVIVEHHHHVLSHWAQYRRTLSKAPQLLTLDHHTDTSFPFRNFLNKNFPPEQHSEQRQQLLAKIDFKNDLSVSQAVALLSHDEHVLTAIGSDIISSVFVVAHNAGDTDASVLKKHRVCCYSVGRDPSQLQTTIKECDEVLESAFLSSAISYFNKIAIQAEETFLKEEYILDIDLDYFNTKKSIGPKESDVFRQLIQGAGLITVATEKNHVALCSREPGLTSEELLESLLNTYDFTNR